MSAPGGMVNMVKASPTSAVLRQIPAMQNQGSPRFVNSHLSFRFFFASSEHLEKLRWTASKPSPRVPILSSPFRPTGATGISSASSGYSTVFAGRRTLRMSPLMCSAIPSPALRAILASPNLRLPAYLPILHTGITQRYVHLDTALVVAADRVAMEITTMLDGGASTERPEKPSRQHLALASAAVTRNQPKEVSASST